MNKINLSVEKITKRYNNICAIEDATLSFLDGEVHALLGENGAGKSTLCKVLSGAIVPDEGIIKINGQSFHSFSPLSSMQQGIGMIYQEFNLIAEMTVYENIFLGKEIKKGLNINKGEMIKKTNEVFDQLNVSIDPLKKIKELSTAYCQLVEIGKAILENAKVLIMDEPTAPLTLQEVNNLFSLVNRLKNQGVTIIYISHRIEELLELSDRVTVMRDGRIIKTLETASTNRDELIRLMVGRDINREFPTIHNNGEHDEVLKVENLTTKKIKDVSFKLYKGEVFGLAGLVGAGRTEIVRAIFGIDPIISGRIWIKGEEVKIDSPQKAIKKGISLIPEDRKLQGIHSMMPILHNMSLVKIQDWSKGTMINRKKEKNETDKFAKLLSIKMSSINELISSLSGGNQQKVVLSKWLATQSDILFFDEPTRGIDVGAKKEIYDLIDLLRNQGKAILLISSEMLEIIGMCNRVLVMHEGKMAGELSASDMTQIKILELASGIITNNQSRDGGKLNEQ
jgi:ribose transport system ATP-binding protein